MEAISSKSIFYLVLILSLIVFHSAADVKSDRGQIKFDVEYDGTAEAILNSTGLGIGTSPTERLHVNGNATVSTELQTGNLMINGTTSITLETVNTSSTLTGANGMYFLNTQGMGNIQLTLPDGDQYEGKILSFKKGFSGNKAILTSPSRIDGYKELELSDGGAVQLLYFFDKWNVTSINSSTNFINSFTSTNLNLYFDWDDNTNDLGQNSIGTNILGTSFANASTVGAIGSGLSFDGVDDYIEVDHNSALNLTDDFTISFWIKPSSNTVNLGTYTELNNFDAPTGVGNEDNGSVAFTLVGNTYRYISIQHDGGTPTTEITSSNLDLSGINWQNFTPNPTGIGGNEGVSVAVDSDGEKLYFAAFTFDDAEESFFTANSNLDFSGFSGWSEREAPDGTGGSDISKIDMVIVDEKMYLGAHIHNGTDATLAIASANIDGSGNISWTSFVNLAGSSAGGEHFSIAIDSDGEKLYYAIFSNIGTNEDFYHASSNLDGTGFEISNELLSPDGMFNDYGTDVDLALIGSKLHYGLIYSNTDNITLHTAYSDLDGTGLQSWNAQSLIHQGDYHERATMSLDMMVTGSNIQYLIFSGNSSSSSENLLIGSQNINSGTLLNKDDAYTLHYAEGGIILEWAGTRLKFGNLPIGQFSHVVITHDATKLDMYIDGQLTRRQTVNLPFNTSSSNLLIGSDGTHFYNGNLDELRLYNHALNSDEIQNLYNGGR